MVKNGQPVLVIMQLSSHNYTTAASFPMVQEQREKSVKIPLEALQMQHERTNSQNILTGGKILKCQQAKAVIHTYPRERYKVEGIFYCFHTVKNKLAKISA